MQPEYRRITPSHDVKRERDLQHVGMAIMIGSAILTIVCVLALIGGKLMSAQQPAPQASYRYHAGAALNDLTVTPGAIGGMTSAQLCDKSFHTGSVRNVPESTKQKVCRLYPDHDYELVQVGPGQINFMCRGKKAKEV